MNRKSIGLLIIDCIARCFVLTSTKDESEVQSELSETKVNFAITVRNFFYLIKQILIVKIFIVFIERGFLLNQRKRAPLSLQMKTSNL